MDKELNRLKYEIYKKSKSADYITFNQFLQNSDISYTFSELEKKTWKKKKNLYKERTKV